MRILKAIYCAFMAFWMPSMFDGTGREKMTCEHLNLYPDMNLQIKMGRCGHFLLHGYWECQDCKEWIFIECEDEWDGREGVVSKDGNYQHQKIDGKNKVVGISSVSGERQ